ncbi:MAG TPA: LysR family transcriptional regulator substrate-binding protein, partial [Chthoniobacterales bacterium]|nr:LysR family transcriptional regulator substrate-binding protein [Chthoniobacterales bacterium]
TEAILEMVRANMGVSILAGWAARSVCRDGVIAKRIAPGGIRRDWYAVTREQPARDSALAALIERLRDDMTRFNRRA